MKILSELVEKSRKEKQKQISGASIFKLYDTYGFPVDMAEDILETEDMSYDEKEFESAMQKQQETSRSVQHLSCKKMQFKTKVLRMNLLVIKNYIKSSIAYIWSKENIREFYLALDKTPFYASLEKIENFCKGQKSHLVTLIGKLVSSIFKCITHITVSYLCHIYWKPVG